MTRDQQTYSVLIVEDNEGDFVLINEYLEEMFASLEITRARNFAETRGLFENDSQDSQNQFDVILLDLSLPDRDGESLIKDVIKIIERTPIIILTGYPDIAFSIKSLTLGISDYLLKEEITSMSLYKSIIYALERKKFIIRLQESERRYSSLFHLSPIPKLLVDDRSYEILQVNQAATKVFGYSSEEFLSMTITDLCKKGDCERFMRYINLQNSIQLVESKRFVHYHRNGDKIDVEVESSPITLDDRKVHLISVTDITEKILFEKKMTNAILKTQEDERYEIGAELHDNVCQLLATSQLCMSLLEESLNQDVMDYYRQSQDMISMALKEIRNLSHQLAPVVFEDSTLEETLEILTKSFNVLNKYTIHLMIEPEILKRRITKEVHLSIFRIIQEQLRNIQKHAQADTILISATLDNANDLLKVEIGDNGIGFDVSSVRGGIGFSNMKRRIELLSGEIHIDAIPTQGCSVKFSIPL